MKTRCSGEERIIPRNCATNTIGLYGVRASFGSPIWRLEFPFYLALDRDNWRYFPEATNPDILFFLIAKDNGSKYSSGEWEYAMEIRKYFTEEIQQQAVEAIKEAHGNEVFFAGNIPPGQTLIQELNVLARGNEVSVPALIEQAHRAQIVIHNHPTGNLTPSEADIQIASLLGQSGIGSIIINNQATELYEIVPAQPAPAKLRLDEKNMVAIIGPDGLIGKRLSNYEYRPEQAKMLQAVTRVFNIDGMGIIEAGTGTGKSLAYLIPAIHWAVLNKERCVISTNTINLQEQLISKDIPFIKEVTKLDFRYCLVKGRSNYLCLQKLQSARSDLTTLLDPDEKDAFFTIIDWAANTPDGSLSDMAIQPPHRLWEKVCAESDTCLNLKCSYYSKCFLFKARREAISADILVVNHHLLFSDLAIRRSSGNYTSAVLLPPYKRVILDEAHNAEDAASSYFGEQITKLGLTRLLGRLYYRRREGRKESRKDNERGILPLLRSHCRGKEGYFEIDSLIGLTLIPSIDMLQDRIDSSFVGFFDFIRTICEKTDGDQKVRLTPKVVETSDWEELVSSPLLELAQSIEALHKELKQLQKLVGKIDDDTLSFDKLQLRSIADRLINWALVMKTILTYSNDGLVRWFEANLGERWESARLLYSPLEVGTRLKESLYDNFSSIVFTSATLSSGDTFQFIKRRLGIDQVKEKQLIELTLPSSFNFQKQVLFCIPTDIPSPEHKEFSNSLCANTVKMLEISNGRAFVLFTSFSLLNWVYKTVEPQLLERSITPLKQGTEDRHRLFKRFRDDISSTLFATDSFWEGVDAPGETLQMVILTKLPFKVPTEPLIEARIEAIEQNDGNAFMEYTVPQAVIKFKQGFGRLIRKKDDIGVIVVYDKRIIEKFYGRLFVNALPKCTVVARPITEVLKAMTRFFAEHRK